VILNLLPIMLLFWQSYTTPATAVPLDLPRSTTICIGGWTVDPATGDMVRGARLTRLAPRALRLLLCLASHAGEVLSIDALRRHVWRGEVPAPGEVDAAVAALQRQLGDDPEHPTYIATVAGSGYRLIATVTPQDGTLPLLDGEPRPARILLLVIALLALVGCLVGILLFDWPTDAALDAVAQRPGPIAATMHVVSAVSVLRADKPAGS
jgi:DNA-binding winged helix-turn-helix (wHTH) protein